jgi:[methyl-Co(III) methanol-specific corrinoid protein]:coenzyme M methyltransferase
MTPKKRFLTALKLGVADRPPVIGADQTATLEQMEKIGVYWPDAHKEADKMALLAAAAWEQTGLESIGVPFCQTVEAEIFGCEILWGNKKTDIPYAPFQGLATPDGVKVPENIVEKGRAPVVLKALEILSEKYGDTLPILGHVIGPFSLAAHLANMKKLLISIHKNPSMVREFTRISIDAIAEYANAMFDCGADAVVVENMFASVDMMGSFAYAKFAAPFDKELIDKLKGPAILHVCGNGDKIIGDMINTGALGLSIDSRTNAEKAVIAAKGKAAIIGNVDTVKALTFGTPEGVREDTLRALKARVDMVSPGCSISPLTPNKNLIAMVDTVKEYRY